jgi:hypothetical protein
LAEAERQVAVQVPAIVTQDYYITIITNLCLPLLIFFLCLSEAIPAESLKGFKALPSCFLRAQKAFLHSQNTRCDDVGLQVVTVETP